MLVMFCSAQPCLAKYKHVQRISKLTMHTYCSFEALLTLQNDTTSIRAQLDQMRNGVTPSRVECIGHSLGAGKRLSFHLHLKLQILSMK